MPRNQVNTYQSWLFTESPWSSREVRSRKLRWWQVKPWLLWFHTKQKGQLALLTRFALSSRFFPLSLSSSFKNISLPLVLFSTLIKLLFFAPKIALKTQPGEASEALLGYWYVAAGPQRNFLRNFPQDIINNPRHIRLAAYPTHV